MNEEELNTRKQKTLHRISLCLIGFALFVFLVLCVLQVVYAILWLLLCVLTVELLAKRENVLYRVEKVYWRERRAHWKQKFDRMMGRLPISTDEFVPDHVLISMDAGQKQQILIDSDDFTIGTKKPCSCVLQGRLAATVSSQHCRITYRRFSRAYYIEDLFSLNGTYLGVKKLEPNTPEKLPDNAEIKIGMYTFRFVKREM